MFRGTLTLLVLLLASANVFATDAGTAISLSDYIAELDRLSEGVRTSADDPQSASSLAKSLPPHWTVRGEGQTFQLPTDWLKGQLEIVNAKPKGDTRRALLAQIVAMKADAEAFRQRPSDVSSYREALTEILARREFRGVHGPSWWDLLQQRAVKWILHFLERLFGSSSFPVISRMVVWGLIALAVVVLAIWAWHTIQRGTTIETILPEGLPVSAKHWPVWMAEAQAAAAKGMWREAVHLAYWAGISFLEERGMWRPDHARTPREYLRLLGSSSEYRGPLSQLTRQLENVWYGCKEAGPQSFADALAHLESLGCRSN